MTQSQRVEGWDPSALDEMAADRDVHRRATSPPSLRRDGRSVGVLGECGDCYQGAQFGAYIDTEALDDARRRHPSAFEPDVGYLLQQSLIDQYGEGAGL